MISHPPTVVLKALETVIEVVKKHSQKKSGKEKLKKGRQFFMRNMGSSDSADSLENASEGISVQQKTFYMIEQWLKFLARPVLDEKEQNSEFCDKLLRFASTRVRKEHLLVLKGLNQQVQNQQHHLIPPPLRGGGMLSIWEKESAICSYVLIFIVHRYLRAY